MRRGSGDLFVLEVFGGLKVTGNLVCVLCVDRFVSSFVLSGFVIFSESPTNWKGFTVVYPDL